MSLSLVFSLCIAILGTAILSGIFGMAGGMILMGVMAWLLPVPAAMILHGVTQTASNGYRAFLHSAHIHWGVLTGYLVGVALAVSIFLIADFVPNTATVLITLGSFPFIAAAIPKRFALDMMRPGTPIICGLAVTVCQLIAGVSGPVLDIFYVNSALTRHQIVATKAITQVIGHVIKLVYYGFIVGTLLNGEVDNIPWYMFAAAILLAMTGTTIGKQVLDRMSDHNFRLWSQRLLMVVGLIFIGRGLMLL